MERADVNLGGCITQDRLKLATERGRGGGSEGDGKDARWRNMTLTDQIRDPTGKRGRLAATGSGQDAERSFASGNRRTLLRRKSVEVHESVGSILRPRSARGERLQFLRCVACRHQPRPAQQECGIQDVV